jgi:hypothetical protein
MRMIFYQDVEGFPALAMAMEINQRGDFGTGNMDATRNDWKDKGIPHATFGWHVLCSNSEEGMMISMEPRDRGHQPD